MAGRHATLPVNDLHFDIDEPEQENIERNSVSSVQESVLLMKTSLRQPANTVMQHRPKIEVGPWMPTNSDTVSVINESAALMATKKGRLTSNLRAPDGVTTALLAGNSRSSGHIVHAGVDPQKYGSMQLRHSILRMSASKTSLGSGLRKCASVEFVLDHVHHQAAQSFYASTSSIGREPRRLTSEEKAELYRMRPDLDIGLDPYLKSHVEELNKRNQRRIVFAISGGFISIILLLFIFSIWERSF